MCVHALVVEKSGNLHKHVHPKMLTKSGTEEDFFGAVDYWLITPH